MKLLTADLNKNVVTHFPTCQTLLKEGKSIVFSAFAKMLDNLRNDRFAEFDSLKKQIELFSNIMEIEIEIQASEFQLQLCNLQSDPILQSKKSERNEAFCEQRTLPSFKGFCFENVIDPWEHLHLQKYFLSNEETEV